MKKYVVGEKYPELIRGMDTVQIDFFGNKGLILIKWRRPSAEEILNVSKGRFQIQEKILNGVMFFTFKFGDLKWIDAPYTPHLSKNPMLGNAGDSFASGIELEICLVNDRNGCIVALRRVLLDRRFSKNVLKDSENLFQETFSAEEHSINLCKVYTKYSTGDLVKMSNKNRFWTSAVEIVEESCLSLFTEKRFSDKFESGSFERWSMEMEKLYDTVNEMVKCGTPPEDAVQAFARLHGLGIKCIGSNKRVIYEEGSERGLMVTLRQTGMNINIVQSPAFAILNDFDFVFAG